MGASEGDPRSVVSAGEENITITWDLSAAPHTYQCIARRDGTAQQYFWG